MFQQRKKEPLVIGTGNDMRIRDDIWQKWNEAACNQDVWKHGRVSDMYRDNYDRIRWDKK